MKKVLSLLLLLLLLTSPAFLSGQVKIGQTSQVGGSSKTFAGAPAGCGAFPCNPVIDNFNRVNANPSDGQWTQGFQGSFDGNLKIVSSQLMQRFSPILAFGDPGEVPLRGGLLVARHGKGYFVYTSLSWFRQLPEGVPGAYRLFANLISLGK